MLIYNFGDWTEWLSQQKVTFLPNLKLISIHPGVTQIDVQTDLYSTWKKWIRYYDNSKWAPAFTTFGGDQTGENQYAPRYFFLTNGWKILVANTSVVVQMNLYSDDGLSPFIIDNASVTNRASDVPIVKSEIEKRLEYGDRIYFDQNSIYNGTAYPVGTIAQPVNNTSDAIYIANQYNIKNFYLLSDFTLNETGNIFENYSIIADRENLKINISDGNYLNNMEWDGFIIDSYFGGGYNKFVDCIIENAYDVSGQMKNCQMQGNVRIWDNLVSSFCYSGVAGQGTPVYDMNENRETKFSLRSYSGGVNLLNCNYTGDTTTLELIAGQIILDSSCTSGYIDIRGVGYIRDYSSGSIIKKTGFIDSFENYIESSREVDERLSYGDSIYYDFYSGYTGTTYPVGTIVKPSNNASDAIIIASNQNITKFKLLSDIGFGQTGWTLSNYSLFGSKDNINMVSYNNDISNIFIENVIIDADFNGNYNTLNNCNIKKLLNFKGLINNSKLYGEIIISGDTDILNSYSGDDLLSNNKEIPSIKLNSNSGITLDIRNYSGDLIIDRMVDTNDYITIDINSGKIILNSGITQGTIDIRGVGYIQENVGSGCTLITKGFISQTLSSEDVDKLSGITSSIDNMTIAVESLDDKVSYISGTTYDMNNNVIIMTSGFTNIESSILNVNNSIIDMEDRVKRILGLVQENFRIMDYSYSGNNLDRATVKIYDNDEDCNEDENPVATYSMTALYDSSGRLIDYKVIKN